MASLTSRNPVHDWVCCPNAIHPMTWLSWRVGKVCQKKQCDRYGIWIGASSEELIFSKQEETGLAEEELAGLRRQPPYYSEREENTCRFSLGQDARMHRGQKGGGKHVWNSSREYSSNTECSRQYPSVTFLSNRRRRFISSSEISYQLTPAIT